MIKYVEEIDDTDYEFLCSILQDIDVSDEYPLYKSDDELVLWLVREVNERYMGERWSWRAMPHCKCGLVE